MAVPFIRYRFDFFTRFEDVTSSKYAVLIRDATIGSDLDLDFKVDEGSPTIHYPSEDGEFTDVMKGSNCTVGFMVQNAADQTFVDNLIADQEGNYFIEILKNGAPFWRGVVAQDESRVENKAFPYIFEITAIDGITELQEESGFIFSPSVPVSFDIQAFHTLLDAIVFMLNKTRTALLYNPEEAFLITGGRWFEVDMPANVDPFANMAYFAQDIEFTYNDRGIIEFESYYDILSGFMQRLNTRIFMNNGVYTILQTNELRFNSIAVFTYSKEYARTDVDPNLAPGGVISSNVPLELKVDLINLDPIQAGVNYNHEAGDLFAYLGAVKSAKLGYDFDQSLTYRAVNEDMLTLFDTDTTIISGVGYNLNFDGNVTLVAATGTTTIPKISTIRMQLTIKIGVNYWDGVNNVWTVTPSFALTQVSATALTTFFLPIYPIKLIIPAPPANGNLEIQTTFDTSGAPGITITDTETTLDVIYQDLSGNPVSFGYTAENVLAPNSSIVLDLGDTIIGDRPGGIQLRQWRTWNGASYQASDLWHVNQVGVELPINEILVEEAVKVRKVPIRKWELELLGDYEPFITVQLNGITSFIFNGGSFNVPDETWSVTLLEIRVPVGAINLGSVGVGANLGGSYNKTVQTQQAQQATFALEAFSSVKLAISTDLAQGTISELPVSGITNGVIKAGDILSLTNLQGQTEFITITIDGEDGENLFFEEVTLLNIYPANSQINISSNNIKAAVSGVTTFAVTGGTSNTLFIGGRTIIELLQTNTYTLPPLSDELNKSIFITFKNISGGNATVQRTSPDLIDSETNVVLAENESLTLYLSDQYRVIN